MRRTLLIALACTTVAGCARGAAEPRTAPTPAPVSTLPVPAPSRAAVLAARDSARRDSIAGSRRVISIERRREADRAAAERAAAERVSTARADSIAAVRSTAASRERSSRRAARAMPVVPPSQRRQIADRGVRTDTLDRKRLSAPVRVCSGGDVTLGTNLDRDWSRMAAGRLRSQFDMSDDPTELIGPLRALVRDADVVLMNVEGAIGSGPTPSKCGPRSTNCFAFRSPPSAALAFRSLSDLAVVGNVANNHARDAGDSGRDSTIAFLGRAGVRVTGADTLATPVTTAAGDTIGVIGFYTSSDTPDARDTAAVYRHVARAAARFPVVIATMHLGAEGVSAQRVSDAREIFLRIDRGNPVAFAEAAVRGGAALVIGHGPHVLRAIEWREGGALIAYSLGNLLTYGPFRLGYPMDRGAVLCSTIDRSGRVGSAQIRSTRQRAPGVLISDADKAAAALVDSLGQLDFRDTGARVTIDGMLQPARPRN